MEFPFITLGPVSRNICAIGDGSGEGGGGGAPPAGGGEGGEGGVTDEMRDFVVRAVNGAVNTAVNDALTRRLNRALDDRFSQNNEALVNQFKEMLQGAAPAEGQGRPAAGDDAIRNAVAPLERRLAEERQARERIEAQARQEREARMRQEEQAALSGALTAAGVAGPLAQAAVGLLTPMLERTEDGQLRFVSREQGPTGPYEERVTVSEGVSRFLKTPDGKHFLPPRPAAGAGNRGGAAPSNDPNVGDADFVASMLGMIGIG